MNLLIGLKTLHIALAVVWFAAPLGLVSLLRHGLAGGPETFKLACATSQRRSVMAAIFGFSTLLVGVGLVFASPDGFGSVSPRIHASLGLVVIMLGFAAGVLKPMGERLGAIAERGLDDDGRKEAEAILPELGMFSGMTHGLWFVILVLMCLP